MAVRNYGGFGQGLAQGFGLVQGIYDRQDRKDLANKQLEADAARDDATARYRQQDLLGNQQYREEQAQRASDEKIATLGFRRQSLQFDAANLARDDAKDADELAWDKNPNNPKNKLDAAQARELTDQQTQREAFDKRIESAGNANEVYTMLQSGLPLDAGAMDRVNELADKNENSFFDFGDLVDYVGQQASSDISTYLQQLSDPTFTEDKAGKKTFLPVEMSDDTKRAYERVLRLDKTAAVGKRVDASFSNAPQYMRDGNYVVVRQGLHSVTATPNVDPATNAIRRDPATGEPLPPTGNGRMFIVVRNQNNGEEDLYTAPITSNRAAYQTEATPLDLGQINEGAMAGAYTANAIGPQMKETVRDARILRDFGDRKTNSDGKAAFNEAVTTQAEQVRKAIQGGDSLSGVQIFLSDAEAADMKTRNVSEQDMALIRDRVADNILFGTTRTPEIQAVSQYINRTAASISKIKMAAMEGYEVVPQGSAPLDGDSVTLGDVFDANKNSLSNDNPDEVLKLNHHAKDPRSLVKYLLDKGYIRRVP